jgi:hypothetical protein
MQVLEFNPENNKLVVWKNAWAYVLITIPLTSITILCWYYWQKVIQNVRDRILRGRTQVEHTPKNGSTV